MLFTNVSNLSKEKSLGREYAQFAVRSWVALTVWLFGAGPFIMEKATAAAFGTAYGMASGALLLAASAVFIHHKHKVSKDVGPTKVEDVGPTKAEEPV